ncbi:hypothetical protein HDK77DRAFT_479076 [Phyllosticta capitalensis]
MPTKRKRTPEADATIQDNSIDAKIKRVKEALRAFDKAAGKPDTAVKSKDDDEAACNTEAVMKSMEDDEDGHWHAIRLANKAADEALKKAQDEGDEMAIRKAWDMTKKARQDIINAELREKTAEKRKASRQETSNAENGTTAQLKAGVAERRAARKQATQARKAEAAERSRIEDIEEQNQLYNALIRKEDPPTHFPDKVDLSQWTKFKKGQTARGEDRVDWEVWVTWSQCGICGTRRRNEEQMRRHWKLDHRFGAKGSEKRKKVRYELQPYLELLKIKQKEPELQTLGQDASDDNSRPAPPLAIRQNDPDHGFDCGLPSNEIPPKTVEEPPRTANDPFQSSFTNETPACSYTRADDIIKREEHFNAGAFDPYFVASADDLAKDSSISSPPPTIKREEDFSAGSYDPYFVASADDLSEAPNIPHNPSTPSLEDSLRNQSADDHAEAPTVPPNPSTSSFGDSLREQSTFDASFFESSFYGPPR